MKKVLKRVLSVVIIYAVVAIITLVMAYRVENLESREIPTNASSSVVLFRN